MASYTYEEYDDEHPHRCKCCRLKNGDDLPIPKELSYDEISAYATKFSHAIFANWTMLNAVLKRFEATIQKRWLKKSLKQKRDILLKAWPGMSATHRPDFASFRDSHRRNAPRTRTCSSDAYLWPQINLEDLQQHHLLLLFLNSRGRNLPEMFVSADLNAAHLGRGWGFDDEWDQPSSEKMMMQFQHQRSPRSYGRMVDYHAAIWIRTIEPYVPGHGLLALEIQDGVYSFLLSCAKLILHDIDPRQYFLAPHLPMPALPDSCKPCPDEWPSLSAHMVEMPYLLPQKMDIDRIKALVASRRASSEDHLWLLREDPGYFTDTLKEWKEHSQERLRHQCDGCMKASGADMIIDAVSNFICWDFVFRRLDSMPPMHAQLRRADWDAVRLNIEDEVAWVGLSMVVEVMTAFALSHLFDGLPASPRMRHCYHWKSLTEDGESIWELRKQFSEPESRVDMLFYALVSEHERSLHGLDKLVQETQYMLDTDAAACQHVDTWITGHFSDLAMLSDLRSRIDGLQPWSAFWKFARVQSSDAVRQSCQKLVHLNLDMQAALCQAINDPKLFQASLDGAFDYPATKRYAEANVEQMRRAEKELDVFWNKIEISVKSTSGLSLKSTIAERLLEPRELHRTAEWIPPLVPQKNVRALAEVSSNLPRFYETFSTTSVETPSKSKAKIKTRGVASSPSVTDDVSSSKVDPGDPNEQKIKVNKRTYRVLAALLPESSAESHQRIEVAWDELLQAMNAIGLQPEKLYGSVWMFRPKEDALVDIKRSIQFHEPKEVRRGSKIPPNMVRTFGRRLKHAYGWEGGMFYCG